MNIISQKPSTQKYYKDKLLLSQNEIPDDYEFKSSTSVVNLDLLIPYEEFTHELMLLSSSVKLNNSQYDFDFKFNYLGDFFLKDEKLSFKTLYKTSYKQTGQWLYIFTIEYENMDGTKNEGILKIGKTSTSLSDRFKGYIYGYSAGITSTNKNIYSTFYYYLKYFPNYKIKAYYCSLNNIYTNIYMLGKLYKFKFDYAEQFEAVLINWFQFKFNRLPILSMTRSSDKELQKYIKPTTWSPLKKITITQAPNAPSHTKSYSRINQSTISSNKTKKKISYNNK